MRSLPCQQLSRFFLKASSKFYFLGHSDLETSVIVQRPVVEEVSLFVTLCAGYHSLFCVITGIRSQQPGD